MLYSNRDDGGAGCYALQYRCTLFQGLQQAGSHCLPPFSTPYVVDHGPLVTAIFLQEEIEWWMIGVVGIFTVLLTWFIVGLQATRAAMINPTESLRAE